MNFPNSMTLVSVAVSPFTAEISAPRDAPPFRPRYIPTLDGLRALAVVGVMLTHFKQFTPHWLWQPVNQGGFGVYLFFVLSGFLITRILLADREKPDYFRNFYARRTLRIFPLYYAVLALNFWVLLPLFPTPATLEFARYQGWLWGYGYNILIAITDRWFFNADWMGLVHFWTLAVEEQFYLAWPLIVWVLPRKSLLKLSIWIVALTPVLRMAFYFAGANRHWYWLFTPCQLDSLALGAMLACLEASGRLSAIAPLARRVALGLCPIFVVCSFFYPQSPEVGLPFIFYHGAVALFFGAIVALAVCGGFRWLDSQLLREIGRKSYGMYVFHLPLLVVAANCLQIPSRLRQWVLPLPRPAADLIFFALMMIATYAVAFISYHAFEKHFLKFKRFFEGTATKSHANISERK